MYLLRAAILWPGGVQGSCCVYEDAGAELTCEGTCGRTLVERCRRAELEARHRPKVLLVEVAGLPVACKFWRNWTRSGWELTRKGYWKGIDELFAYYCNTELFLDCREPYFNEKAWLQRFLSLRSRVVPALYAYSDEERLLVLAAGGTALASLPAGVAVPRLPRKGQSAAITQDFEAAGCYHNDLSTANVLLSEEGRIMVTDFDSATQLSPTDDNFSLSVQGIHVVRLVARVFYEVLSQIFAGVRRTRTCPGSSLLMADGAGLLTVVLATSASKKAATFDQLRNQTFQIVTFETFPSRQLGGFYGLSDLYGTLPSEIVGIFVRTRRPAPQPHGPHLDLLYLHERLRDAAVVPLAAAEACEVLNLLGPDAWVSAWSF